MRPDESRHAAVAEEERAYRVQPNRVEGRARSDRARRLDFGVDHFDRGQTLVEVVLLDERNRAVVVYAVEMDMEDAATATKLVLDVPDRLYFGFEPLVEIRLGGVVLAAATLARRIEVHRL